MKIEIETKYNIGDIVWIKCWFDDETGYYPSKARISGIDVQVYDKAIRNISYFLGDNVTSYDESDLFSTKEECQAECNRLNEGSV